MNFLKLIGDFDKRTIAFREEYKFSEHQMSSNETVPYVMDPSNPYNNLASQYKYRHTLKMYAKETMDRIVRAKRSIECFTIGGDKSLMEYIFSPQPLHIDTIPTQLLSANYLVGTRTEVKWFPDLKVRNKNISPDIMMHVDIIQNYLAIKLAAYSRVKLTNQIVRGLIQEVVRDGIFNKPISLHPSELKHEDCDVTFTLPSGEEGCALLSNKFK